MRIKAQFGSFSSRVFKNKKYDTHIRVCYYFKPFPFCTSWPCLSFYIPNKSFYTYMLSLHINDQKKSVTTECKRNSLKDKSSAWFNFVLQSFIRFTAYTVKILILRQRNLSKRRLLRFLRLNIRFLHRMRHKPRRRGASK